MKQTPEYYREANKRSYQKHKSERLAKQKAYRQSEAGKATQARKDKKQQKLNPIRWSARQAVWRAVKSEKLNKPQFCEQPGCYENSIEAHHWRGYDREHWLDVVFLCNYHHVEAHTDPEWRLGELVEELAGGEMRNHYYICDWCGSPVTAGEIQHHELHCTTPKGDGTK